MIGFVHSSYGALEVNDDDTEFIAYKEGKHGTTVEKKRNPLLYLGLVFFLAGSLVVMAEWKWHNQSASSVMIEDAIVSSIEASAGATRSPSKKPSVRPSTPSRSPSFTPTRNPTSSPTTKKPTVFPTSISKSPSYKPTDKPSKDPTSIPSTRIPTTSPTKKPTYNPTIAPSKTPSNSPTNKPSRMPTMPTYSPSSIPTSIDCPSGQSAIISTNRLNNMISSLATHMCTEAGGYYKSTKNKCLLTDGDDFATVLGGILRLSFHDSVTYNATDGSSGPDGCVNFDSGDNGGLYAIWYSTTNASTACTLDMLYSTYSGYASKGDFIAIAANVAVMLASGPDIYGRTGAICSCVGSICAEDTADTTSPCVNIRGGRIDSTTCASTDEGRLPSSQLAHQHILDVFQTRLGFTNKEIVALMGAHTLGRSTLSDAHVGFTTAEVALSTGSVTSSLPGRWTNSPSSFDSTYFNLITKFVWAQETHNTFEDGVTAFTPSTMLWSCCKNDAGGGGTQLMLNTDMALVWDVTMSTTNALQPACTSGNLGGVTNLFSKCSEYSPFSTYVYQFANGTEGTVEWFATWSSAWTKMQELGWSSGVKGSLYSISTNTCY